MCYGTDISIGHSGTFFCVVCPKISTSQEKLALTGLHGLHVFATLLSFIINVSLVIKYQPLNAKLVTTCYQRNQVIYVQAKLRNKIRANEQLLVMAGVKISTF